MRLSYINLSSLKNFNLRDYESKNPFPHHIFGKFLTPKGFQTLWKDFPPLTQFEKNIGRYRGLQRPHNRYLLSFEHSVYHDKKYRGKGLVFRKDLPKSWQSFLKELEGKAYKDFVRTIIGTSDFGLHCEWHLGFKGSEVSPHKDAPYRLGNQLFYFNTREDWKTSWGGNLLLLGDKMKKSNPEAPEYADFKKKIRVPNVGNRSVVFHNTESAWHGVEPLECPQDHYRRVFVVIFARLGAKPLLQEPRPYWKVFLSKIKQRMR